MKETGSSWHKHDLVPILERVNQIYVIYIDIVRAPSIDFIGAL